MREYETTLGRLKVAAREELFEILAGEVDGVAKGAEASVSMAFSGGSTPLAWYDWAVGEERFSAKTLRHVIWTTSDERYVPLEDPESNFGNAIRHFLQPLGIGNDKYLPWPVDLDPEPGALTFQSQWANRFGPERAFDLCLLGLGEDCHTASLFPGSPLFHDDDESLFGAVEVPGKGWRYTVTPRGLGHCGKILVLALGSGKQEALRAILSERADPQRRPAQVLGQTRESVTFLCDPEAVAQTEYL